MLAFGYWCTDFLVVQRAMAAESMSAARRTPVIATIPKILIPAIVIIPGMIALVAKPHEGVFPDTYQTSPPKVGDVVKEKIAPPYEGLIPPKTEEKDNTKWWTASKSRCNASKATTKAKSNSTTTWSSR